MPLVLAAIPAGQIADYDPEWVKVAAVAAKPPTAEAHQPASKYGVYCGMQHSCEPCPLDFRPLS